MIRLITLFLLVILPVNSGLTTQAQADDVTPRQTFTAFATGTSVEELRYKPFGMNSESPKYDSITTSKAPELQKPEPHTKSASTLPKAPLTQTPKDPAPIAASPPVKRPAPPLAPFYVAAKDYLAARGIERHNQVKLSYAVTLSNQGNGLEGEPKITDIIIGPNYVSIRESDITRIFDFRMNRLLTIETKDQRQIFQNVSLYPSTYKKIQTVKGATQNGTVSSIPLSETVALDAFWLEASMGWTARQHIDGLSVTRSGKKVSTSFKSETPLTMDLEGFKLPSDAHMRSFYAFLLHDLPIHPAILPKMGRPDHAPKSMAILSYGPKYITGQKADWILRQSESIRGSFPLPKDAVNSVSLETASPLARAIFMGAAGKTVTDRPSQSELRDKIQTAKKNGDLFEAWTAAQILSHRIGGCDKDRFGLCKQIKSIEAQAGSDSAVGRLAAIIDKAESKSRRSQGFEELLPFISDGSAPAFLFKIAGQARSKLTKTELSDPALSVIRADSLLEQALIKEPDDPETYVTLAQVYAAQGRFEESWDIQDTLRLLPNAASELKAPINRAEKTLNRIAPGFFVAKGP